MRKASPDMNVSSFSAALVKAADNPSGAVAHGSAAMRVYAALRAQIISLHLLPDTTLVRNDIARSFGVSQSPVREAIQKLEQEGLVISYPQSRTVVSKIDVAHARETQFLRVSVELEVAQTLAQAANPALLGPTSRLLRMQKLAGDDCDIGEFTTLDRLFHLSLFEAAGVRALWHVIADRSGHIDRLRRLNLPDPGKIAQVLRDHEAILSAIASGDRGEVEAAVRTHLSGTLAAVAKIRDQHPHYF
ncbi:GntR family transcriptional regulator [Aquibium carbonis]|uniref:GntR family transcriptional regulator n=1 Tax=Aquibium carbonis TaxID=2495581 RepID=A0A429YR22_9HYPH|nr:GntR family transcriptional regulator [Aquibium carbonis]RST83868.1 GntR family transcriptional regulator [Aquibium carbonis]